MPSIIRARSPSGQHTAMRSHGTRTTYCRRIVGRRPLYVKQAMLETIEEHAASSCSDHAHASLILAAASKRRSRAARIQQQVAACTSSRALLLLVAAGTKGVLYAPQQRLRAQRKAFPPSPTQPSARGNGISNGLTGHPCAVTNWIALCLAFSILSPHPVAVPLVENSLCFHLPFLLYLATQHFR